MRRIALLTAFVYGVAFPFGLAWLVRTHLEATMSVVSWIRSAGWLGVALYAVTYILGSVLLVPVLVMSALGGFLFGPLVGLAVVSPANAIGAFSAFLAGRLLLRRWIEPLIAANPRVAAIDRAVGDRGVRLTFLLRLSPALPHNMLNYAMATTRVPAREFALGTWLGALPITAVQVFAGAHAQNLGALFAHGTTVDRPSLVLGAAGIVATAVVIWTIARAAKRELTRMMEEGEDRAERASNPGGAPGA
ncbi:MAG: TVP38/TMEM64 family protein [Deltaproteobacteria bacterium]